MARRRGDRGWYTVFALLAVVAFVGIYYLSGKDAFGAAGLIIWNAIVVAYNLFVRVVASFAALLARGVGVRRLSRIMTAIGGIGLGYAGSVVLNEARLARAQQWRDKLRASMHKFTTEWRMLTLPAKLIVVGLMIAVQLYLHWMLIIFPIGFLVPIVRRVWVQAADAAFGGWYWQTFGKWHRKFLRTARNMPIVRHMMGAMHLTRLRYLTAWRLWRHHPRYRDAKTSTRVVSIIEPFRLLMRGELDQYVGRPLLAGRNRDRPRNNGSGMD